MSPTALSHKTCPACQKHLPRSSYYLFRQKGRTPPRISYYCRSCQKERGRNRHAALSKDPIERTLAVTFRQLLHKARSRRPCNLTIDDLFAAWKRQNGLCALTGWPLTTTRFAGRVPTNVSIDRIDNSLDYTSSNIQLVCLAANQAKAEHSHSDLLDLCKSIVATSRRRTKRDDT